MPRLEVFSFSTDRIARQADRPGNPPKRIHLHTFSDSFIRFNGYPEGLDPKSFQPYWELVTPSTTTVFKAIKKLQSQYVSSQCLLYIRTIRKWIWKNTKEYVAFVVESWNQENYKTKPCVLSKRGKCWLKTFVEQVEGNQPWKIRWKNVQQLHASVNETCSEQVARVLMWALWSQTHVDHKLRVKKRFKRP